MTGRAEHHESAAGAMRRLNRAWLEGRVEDMAPLLHPEAAMALPGFSGSVRGRDALLAGFRQFVGAATILEFDEGDYHVDVAGDTAVVTYTYRMRYEQGGTRRAATGRDLWVFERRDDAWLALWRTMLDADETTE